jgi:hypothetical protein
MRGCDGGCHFGTSSKYGGSLLHRRCANCGAVELDLRDGAPGVMALFEITYEPFDADFGAYEARRGARN